MRSMTGFATHSCVINAIKTTIEIKSVNHRYLDVYIKTPRTLTEIETDIRKVVQKYITRGKVSLQVSFENGAREEISLNKPLLASVIRSLRAAKKDHPFLGDIHFADVLRVPNIFIATEEKKLSRSSVKHLLTELEKALVKFVATREREGGHLEKDISKRLKAIDASVTLVDKERNVFIENSKNKMIERIRALLEDVSVNEDRLMKEVAFLLEKVDISEEIVRLRAHLKLFSEMLLQKEKCGKDLDFVTQEMNREINTIGSKAQDSTIARHVIAIKSEIEKIREQLQNIE
ncbi:MAG: YicC family protein [Candidatus Omnitrophica bacterium]|nr:YicC family protein [Candidatus Omnitrophota bacterium]